MITVNLDALQQLSARTTDLHGSDRNRRPIRTEQNMKRILVIGSGGAGKTTFALRLGHELGLPVHHLDRLWWLPGWQAESRKRFDAKLAALMQDEAWIIDGNYPRTLPARLARADTVVVLDYSRWLCLFRALVRNLRFRDRGRPDMGDDCPERMDCDFLRQIWNFERDTWPRLDAALAGFDGRIVILKTPAAASAWLDRSGA